MLTTPLIALLSAVPVLGEAGESCRTNADCEPSLSCVARTCTARPLPPVPTVTPAPVVAPTPASTVDAPAVDTTTVEENPAPAGHFSGVHFLLGALGGVGWMWSNSSRALYDAPIVFSADGPMFQGEVRVGVLFGRFELAAELAPFSVLAFPSGTLSQHATAAVSAGWMLGLYEREGFSISLPIRARGGLLITRVAGGGLVGASAGLALRFGNAIVEARLLGAEYRALSTNSNIGSLPLNLSFSWIF